MVKSVRGGTGPQLICTSRCRPFGCEARSTVNDPPVHGDPSRLMLTFGGQATPLIRTVTVSPSRASRSVGTPLISFIAANSGTDRTTKRGLTFHGQPPENARIPRLRGRRFGRRGAF